MNILVCISQVPDTTTKIQVSGDGQTIDKSGVKFILNPYDEFAIEEGIDPEILDTVVDPVLIKFVDDYRRLKQGVTQGTAKRKNVKVRKAPVKKAKTQ